MTMTTVTIGGISSLVPMTVANIASFRTGTIAYSLVYLSGYFTTGDGGEGYFNYVSTDTTSADNNGTIIVDASGHRYYRSVGKQYVTPQHFGAKGNTRTVTDGIMTAGSAVLTSPTATFTSADVGKAVSVIGVGAPSCSFSAYIVNNQYTASISVSTLTVPGTGTATGIFWVGAVLTGANVAPGTTITAILTGTGGAGTYSVNIPQTVASTIITANAQALVVTSVTSGTLSVGMPIAGNYIVPGTAIIAMGNASIVSNGSTSPYLITGTTGTYVITPLMSQSTITSSITSGTATLTSASLFTSAMVGYTISIPGAGPSGAALSTFISSFVNASTVTLATVASTTVTNASSTFYGNNTFTTAEAMTVPTTLNTTISIYTSATQVILASNASVSIGNITQGNVINGNNNIWIPSGNFTSADIGLTLNIAGAGPGGGMFSTTIQYIYGVSSAILSSLPSTSVTSASITCGGTGVSIGSDDTTALQNWLTYINIGNSAAPTPPYYAVAGNTGFIPTGRYKITSPLSAAGPTGTGFFMPSVKTVGAEYCIIDAFALTYGQVAITMIGGSGSTYRNTWEPITVDGGYWGNGATGFRSNGKGWYTLLGWGFTNLNIGGELLNANSPTFTEGFWFDKCVYGNLLTAIKYNQVPGTTSSFRSSGLKGDCAISLNQTNAVPIVTTSGCVVYFCPLEATFWPPSPLYFGIIQNNAAGFGTDYSSWVGTITLEGNTGGVYASGQPCVFSGNFLTNSFNAASNAGMPNNMSMGTMTRVQDFVMWGNGSCSYTPVAQNFTRTLPAGSPNTTLTCAMTSGSATLTNSAGLLTSAMVGYPITVNGAGASGANLVTFISSVTNSTTAVLQTSASTTVSSATTTVMGGTTINYPFPTYPGYTGDLMQISIVGNNYTFEYIYSVCAAGNNIILQLISTQQTFNSSGWGAPTIVSTNTSNNSFIVANGSWGTNYITIGLNIIPFSNNVTITQI